MKRISAGPDSDWPHLLHRAVWAVSAPGGTSSMAWSLILCRGKVSSMPPPTHDNLSSLLPYGTTASHSVTAKIEPRLPCSSIIQGAMGKDEWGTDLLGGLLLPTWPLSLPHVLPPAMAKTALSHLCFPVSMAQALLSWTKGESATCYQYRAYHTEIIISSRVSEGQEQWYPAHFHMDDTPE